MINLVIALDCEASPLIQHYGLKRLHAQHAFKVYQGEQMQLIVSGVGKLNAAAATAYLAGLNQVTEDMAWLNIGIAGHRINDIGKAYLGHKILDHATQQCWYSSFCFKPALNTDTIATFDQPVTQYHDDMLHDMEAAGFFAAAMHLTSVEFVHSLKVVSDNTQNHSRRINKAMVKSLIQSQLDAIATTVEQLIALTQDWQQATQPAQAFDEIMQQWHFSTYQQHQLRHLLKRWQTLYPQQPVLESDIRQQKDSRAVLKYLQARLQIQ